MIQQMLTLFPKAVNKMDKGELEAELKVQRWLRRFIAWQHYKLELESTEKKYSWIRENKIEFCEIYLKNLDALISQINFYIQRRTYEGSRDYMMHHATRATQEKYRAEMKKRQRLFEKDNVTIKKVTAQIEKDEVNISWDREKFLLVAQDRGYLTEEGIVYAISNEFGIQRPAAQTLINKGKFTWGQVMCIGALFEMTPKEFCDIFLSGYFVQKYGEFRASYDNIDRTALLKRVTSLNKNKLLNADTDISDQT